MKQHNIFLMLVAVIGFCAGSAHAGDNPRVPVPERVLDTLISGHPRLMLDDAGLAGLKRLRADDPVLDSYIDDVMAKADNYLDEPVLSYTPREGRRLLSVGRECMNRMYTLGIAWRLTGDDRYAERAVKDLLAICELEDWTPSLAIIYPLQEKHKQFEKRYGQPPYSFLDVSETCHAVGIGYDWFYHFLSGEAREKVRSNLIKKGLDLGLQSYTGIGSPTGTKAAWITYEHNWNLVCNSGLVIGALAIADTNQEIAEVIVPGAVESLPIALKTYGPDGAWPEGPSYWGYATSYAVYGLAALESALGTDFGLSDIPGLSETGYYPLDTAGPTGLYLNFADSPENNRCDSSPCLFWLARRFDRAYMSDREHVMLRKSGAGPQHLLWYVPPSGRTSYHLKRDIHLRGPVELALFRSALNDPEALFVGVKGGDNTFNHSHLDLGNFELDALGVRWARDLGSEDYSLPGYFDFYYLTKKTGGKRWSYFRGGSGSHNVPLLNGGNQNELARATFLTFRSGSGRSIVTVDLGDAYEDHARKAVRGVAMVEKRRAVLVQDEFDLREMTGITWGMTTDADIELQDEAAVLKLDGKELTARILSPAGAVFTVESVEQDPPQKRNEGVRRLVVRLPRSQGSVRIAVLLSPCWPDGTIIEKTDVVPLDEW